MPTYSYKCEECGYVFERFHAMRENFTGECPACSGKIKRLIGSGAGIIVKGGFARICKSNPACSVSSSCGCGE